MRIGVLPKDFAGFNFARDSLFEISIDIYEETRRFYKYSRLRYFSFRASVLDRNLLKFLEFFRGIRRLVSVWLLPRI